MLTPQGAFTKKVFADAKPVNPQPTPGDFLFKVCWPTKKNLFSPTPEKSESTRAKVKPMPITQAIDTLKFLHPGGEVFELCAIGPKTPRGQELWEGFAGGKKAIVAGYYKDPAAAARLAIQIKAEGLYVTLNPCQKALLARADHRLKANMDRTADHHIDEINNLLIDVDPKRPTGISSIDQEHVMALEMAQIIKADMAKEGWPDPLVGDSGNGGHLIYPLHLPNNQESVDLIKAMSEALALRYADQLKSRNLEIDQKVHNPARLTKLYGTMVRKGDNTQDRPHRLAQIISLPEIRQPVPLELLKKLAATIPAQEPAQPQTKEPNGRRLDVAAYLAHYGIEVVKVKPHKGGFLYGLRECVFDPSHTDNEAAIGQTQEGKLYYQCFHNSCKDCTWAGAKAIISGGDRLTDFMIGGRRAGEPTPQKPQEKPAPKDHQVGEDEGKAQEPGFADTELLNFARAGQVGDARLFIRLFKGTYCYDHAAGRWFKWGDHYWIEDDLKNVLIALDRVIDIYEQQAQKCAWRRARATRDGNDTLAKQAAAEETIFLKKITQLQKKDWRKDVLEFASAGEGSLGISGKEWDSTPLLIACSNGVIDLDTGGFRDGRPDDFIKTACPTEWHGQLEPAPQWDKFLEQIFDGDRELIFYGQRLCGYATSGQRKERVTPFACGSGWNGKGTYFETMGCTLGKLAGPVPAELLLEESKHHHKSGGAPTPEIMMLRGKRLVWASETNEGRRLNAGKVKWLTGGDTLIGRDPFGKKMVAFPPTHTLFLMTNHKPKTNPDDLALWGRLHIIPFDLSFVDNPTKPLQRKRDKHLADKLKKEAPGILAWLVRGFFEWKKRGLDPPPKVLEATEQYRQEQDTVGQFIAEKCKLAAGMQVKSSEMFKEYRQWCDDNGFMAVWGNIFGESMKAKFAWKTTMNGVFYYGIGLLEQDI